LASRYGVSAETIVCGNGASDLIYRIVAASRPRVGATLPCTFSEYGAALRLFGADVVMWSPADMGYAAEVVSASVKANESAVAAHTLPLRSGVASASATATEGVLAADDAKVYFVCNPNNPTSELVDHASLVALADQCERTDAVLVVDECFMEFVDEDAANSLIPLLATHRNLVVLRAFTKSYALPGVRLGYALCGSPELTQQIAQSGPPWSVSALAQSIGLAALCDPDYLSHMRAWISAERPRFVAELTGTGVEVYPPQANFVLFRISESRDPQRFFADVLAAGFLLRRCTDFHGLDERHFRSAIKTPEQNNQLLAAIRAALKRA
jgi:threonine-phosphate decarboxylase